MYIEPFALLLCGVAIFIFALAARGKGAVLAALVLMLAVGWQCAEGRYTVVGDTRWELGR